MSLLNRFKVIKGSQHIVRDSLETKSRVFVLMLWENNFALKFYPYPDATDTYEDC